MHAEATAAQDERYRVVDGTPVIEARWARLNGW